MLKYFFHMSVMFGHIIQVDEYIIQIDHNTDIQKVRKNIVHKLLEGRRTLQTIQMIHNVS